MDKLHNLLLIASLFLVSLPRYALNQESQGEDTMNPKGEPWEDNFRLPNTTHADHYDLYIFPNLQTKMFSGRVAITLSSTEARDYFLVQSKLLNITLTRITKMDGGSPQYELNEFWVMKTELVLPGIFEIYLEFEGSLTNGLVGFYYSEYTNEFGEKRGLAATKFQPTYARRAFPCFDEPDFRSTFNTTVVRPSSDGYIVLSNMPVLQETPNSPQIGLTEVSFQKSVSMVVYLVCFVICDFIYVENIMNSGMPFRVYSPPQHIGETQYALSVGSDVLEYFEGIFGIPFPLPKNDMAAIPDYASGATEHWGIITYRETTLYYNSSINSASNKQRVTVVIAHEMAHQWFGNLVTLAWWDDLWLNEGFASFIEYKGTDFLQPTWDMYSQFVINLQSVFVLDSKLSSHPIIHPVQTPDEITAVFDSIAYDKGSSILRMLEDFMGEANFMEGINSFLVKYSFDNAVTQDLWDELTLAWADTVPPGQKMGYPVVTVNRTASDTITLVQKRFLQDSTLAYDPSESPFNYTWDIPISYISQSSPSPLKTWFYRENSSVEIPVGPSDVWYKINIEEIGYYRVNYEVSVWQELQNLCISKELGPADRSSLYDDSLALADAALLPYEVALNFTESLVNESHYVPWNAAIERMSDMVSVLLETDVYQPFQAYGVELTDDIYNSLGWEDTGIHIQKLLRNEIVAFACKCGHNLCLNESAVILQSWVADELYPVPLGTTRQMFRWGIIHSDTPLTWMTMWQRCLNESNASQRSNLYYGMANSQDEATLLRYIQLSQDEKNVRSQDFLDILEYIAWNPAGTDLVWYWVRANWEWLVDRYTLNDRYLGQLIPNISMYFATNEKLIEMEVFFAQYPDAGAGEMYRQQALETVKSNIRWVNSYSSVILNWLNNRPVK